MTQEIRAAIRWRDNNGQPKHGEASSRLKQLLGSGYRAINPVYATRSLGGLPPMFEHCIYSAGKDLIGDDFGHSLILEKVGSAAEIAALRTEFDGKLAAAEAKHKQDVEEILAALKGASHAALREASLRIVTEAIQENVLEELPDRLAKMIEEEVAKAFERAAGEG